MIKIAELFNKAISLLLAVIMVVGILPGGLFASSPALAAGGTAELRSTVQFSTTTPKSGDEFFMDIHINSASLGTESGVIEDLHIEFNLPGHLSVVQTPIPFGGEFAVNVTGSHIEVDWTAPVPVGAPQRLRFVLAWDTGVTIQGIDSWLAPEIHVDATSCVGTVATHENGFDPAPAVNPVNTAPSGYMTVEYQDVYVAFMHTATVNLYNEPTSGGLNLQKGKVTFDVDSEAHIAAIKLNGETIIYTPELNIPASGRTTIIIDIPDDRLEVTGGWSPQNVLQIIYNYPPDLMDDYIPVTYDMNIKYTAERLNGAPVDETDKIHEEHNFGDTPGPAKGMFNKTAPASFVRVQDNTLNWIISFDSLTDVENIVIIDDPMLNEPDFFDGFRFSRVEVTAYDPYLSALTRTRTKIYYEHSGDPGNWHEVPTSEVTAAGNNQYSWTGSSLTSAALGLGANYVTSLKFELYGKDGVSTIIPALSGKVQIRLFASSTAGIVDGNSGNSFDSDNTVTNTLTASGTMIALDGGADVHFTATDVTITTNTALTGNHPVLYWEYQPNDWYYANGGVNPGAKDDNLWGSSATGSWSVNYSQGEWRGVNSAGGATGSVRIGDETWVVERWLIEGGYFYDPIVYFYVPDPNIEILGVEMGRSLYYSDLEYFTALGGGTIVKFKIQNAVAGIPGNPVLTSSTPGWDSYLPAFGSGDPGGYGASWGHWWPRCNELAIKIKFKPGAKDSSVSGNIQVYMTSGDPEQWGPSALAAGSPLVESGAAAEGQTLLASRGFGYTIDFTEGLHPVAAVSQDDILYTQVETIDNSSSLVDVYLKMSAGNPLSESYGALSKIRLIDMLPYAGDTMAISSSPKGSTRSLTGYEVYKVSVNGVEIPFADLATAGIRVYYSTTADFMTNRQELRDVTVAVVGHWTLSMDGLIPNGAKALMVEKDGLAQGDSLEVILKAKAPVDSDTSKYWHSLAAGGHYGTTNIVPGEPLKSGFTGLGSNSVTVSGLVWDDVNRNGIKDAGESCYPGLTMRLCDNLGNIAAYAVTGPNGEYSFADDFIAGSTWHIEFDLPADYALTLYHAAAPAGSINNEFIEYLGTPTVFFTFSSPTAGDIDNLNAGIFDNNVPTGSLNISKKLTGNNTDPAKDFHFTVTFSDGGTYSGIASGAVGAITLKGDGDFIIMNIPQGVDYTVVEAEANQDGYTTSSTGAQGIIGALKSEAIFTNHKNRGGGGGGPTDPVTASATLTAKKTVSGVGATLAAGQFSFAVYEGQTRVATGTNDLDGNITFTAINYTSAGTHNYTIKETSTDGNGWITDKTEYTVTVTVTSNGTALSARVSYDTEPVFNNRYSKLPSAKIYLSKKLVDENGNPTDSGKEFTLRLTDSADKLVGEYKLPANGGSVEIPDLPGGGTYKFQELTISGYSAQYAVYVYGRPVGTMHGATNSITIPQLGRDVTIRVVITNTPGTDTGGGGTIEIKIDDEDVPLAFIDEHIAYIIGYPDGTVRPNQNITRAEVATVFFRLLTDMTRAMYWTQDNAFDDVASSSWYNNAISVMSEMGIVTGYPDGTFRPDGAITRAELAAIAARFARAGYMDGDNDVSFSDISGHWAQDDILYAASLGWVNGYPDGTYRPNQPITRAEFIALVNRMLMRVPETVDDLLRDEMLIWIDNADPDVWYYLAVQEATNSHIPEYKENLVPDQIFEYEFWVEMLENRDWAALEKVWSDAFAG